MSSTIIYARKSTESEDRQILSIDSQIRELQEFAARQGLQIDHVYSESKSAKAPGRPVFSEILEMVNRKEVDKIVCWKLDRLARNPVDGGALIWAFEEGKLGRIITPQRTFENTGDNKFWMQLEFGMAKKYVDDLSENVRRGLRAKLDQGWMPGKAPIGYLNNRNERNIVPDPKRFPLVKRMWELMLKGTHTPLQILDIATNEWGLETLPTHRRGGKPLSPSGVYNLFRQPFYYGAIVRKGLMYQGVHKPMIKKSEFDRVQGMIHAASNPRPQVNRFAFVGMIKCGECGASVTAEHKVQRHGHEYVYYHCTKRKRDKNCQQRVIEVKKLESQILAFLDSLTVSPRIVEWAGWVLNEMQEEEYASETAALDSLRRRHDNCKRELKELYKLKLRGMISDHDFVNMKNDLLIERFKLKELVEDNDDRFVNFNEETLKAFRFAESAVERFENGTWEEKRAVLRYTGSNLILQDGILTISEQIPLFKIRKALSNPEVKTFALEPPSLSELKRKTKDASGALRVMYRLVKDVRTCVMRERLQSCKMALNEA